MTKGLNVMPVVNLRWIGGIRYYLTVNVEYQAQLREGRLVDDPHGVGVGSTLSTRYLPKPSSPCCRALSVSLLKLSRKVKAADEAASFSYGADRKPCLA